MTALAAILALSLPAASQLVIDRSVPDIALARAELPAFSVSSRVERKTQEYLRATVLRDLDAFVAQAKREVPRLNRERGTNMAYEMVVTAEAPTRQPRLVSGIVRTYAFTLGAHGNTRLAAFAFLEQGGKVRQLGLRDVFATEKGLEECSTLLVARLVMSGRAPWIDMGLSGDIRPARHGWVLEPDGIRFFMQPYSVAPYSSGVIEALVPFKDFLHPLDPAVMAALRER